MTTSTDWNRLSPTLNAPRLFKEFSELRTEHLDRPLQIFGGPKYTNGFTPVCAEDCVSPATLSSTILESSLTVAVVRAISCVAALCSSTAAAIPVETSLIYLIVVLTLSNADTEPSTAV